MDLRERLQRALGSSYLVERELGQGGMPTVFLADDPKHERQVAIKVLRPELAAALGPERFTREIRIAARLQHPHILPQVEFTPPVPDVRSRKTRA
jgi:serine/threonine protein kinase